MQSNDHNGNAVKPWLQLSITIANAGDAPRCSWEDRDLDDVMNALDTVRRHIEAQWRMDKAKMLTLAALAGKTIVLPAQEWDPARR